MAASLQIQRVTTLVNQEVWFNFDGVVLSYLAGISYFDFSYGYRVDHWVTGLTLSLQHSNNGTQVSVTPNANIWDGTGHQIASYGTANGSVVTVVVLAWIATQDELIIQEVLGVPSGAKGPIGGVPLTMSTTPITQAVLSGFDIQFPEQHHVMGVKASAAISNVPSASMAYITSQADMYDGSGHHATTATVDGWLIAASVANPGFYVQEVTPTPQTWTQSTSVDFSSIPRGQMLIDGAVLLTGFTVQYPPGSDHCVQHISAGAMDWSIGRSEITLPTAGAFMWDNSGHGQGPSPGSQASLLAIGLVGTDPAQTR